MKPRLIGERLTDFKTIKANKLAHRAALSTWNMQATQAGMLLRNIYNSSILK